MALRRRPGFRPQVGRRSRSLRQNAQIDVLHCHQYSPFVYGRIATAWSRRLKIVYTEHGRLSDAPPSWKRRLVNPWLSRFDGSIVAVSDELREYMIDARFPPGRVEVVHNGIEPAPSRRARIGGAPGSSCGSTTSVRRRDGRAPRPGQGPDDAPRGVRDRAPARAAAQLLVSRRRPRARSAGGASRGTRPRWIGAHDGYRSDVRALLPAADLYVNSSISEGVSITILEAMAAGIPVVATAVGGTPEVLPDEADGGILVPCRDPERLASAIASLALDPGSAPPWRQPGAAASKASFTIDRMVDDYARIYRGLCGLIMCGICGVVALDGELHPDAAPSIGPMTATLAAPRPGRAGRASPTTPRRSATAGWRSSTAPAATSR